MKRLALAILAVVCINPSLHAKKTQVNQGQKAGTVSRCSMSSAQMQKALKKKLAKSAKSRGKTEGNSADVLDVFTSKYHPDVVVIKDDGRILKGKDIDLCEAAKAYYSRFSDDRDFLFIFGQGGKDRASGFNAYYQSYQNSVKGIGKKQYNNSHQCGSAGRLLGLANMNGTDKWKAFIFPGLELWPAGVIAHEIGHQWIANFDKPVKGIRLSNPKDYFPYHWQPLLDSDASIMYGNNWMKTGKKSFVSTALPVPGSFSELDMYMMGLIPASKVKPFFAIDAESKKIKSHYARPGQTAKGKAVTITIEDIQKVYGEREPSYSKARRDFRATMILVVPKGQSLQKGPSKVVNYLRKAIPRRLKAATKKLMSISTSMKCDADGHCGDDQYCNKGFLGIGQNRCASKRASKKNCTRKEHCISGKCTLGLCAQIAECTADKDCKKNQYCKGVLKAKTCASKKKKGAFCVSSRVCQSKKCSWGRCK